jgi:Transposase DNA-binding
MPDDFTDEFAYADLKDPRRSRRLSKVATALMKSPGMSISAACGGWNETVAAYRLLNCEDVCADIRMTSFLNKGYHLDC